MTKRTIDQLSLLDSFEDRFGYLKLTGSVGRDIFGDNRFLNQQFYQSRQWRDARNQVLIRDDGLDLGCVGYPIFGQVIVHHMNPVTEDDLLDFNPDVLNPRFLISVSVQTHQAIHYGINNFSPRLSIERRLGDTKLW
jgi:hypothetical protein